MICSIHQPNFFPWIGYFDKIARSDVFVFLNQVDYEKSGHSMQCYTNRVAVLDKNNAKKNILCPVVREHGPQKIDTVRIKPDIDWKIDVITTIKNNYEDAPFKDETYGLLDSIWNYKTDYLSEFNINAVTVISDALRLDTKIVRQDELDTHYHSTELLAEITNKVGCSHYLYGGGGSKYQEERYFDEHHVVAVPQGFIPWEYKQRDNNSFVGGLSILDALFWIGIDATSEKLVKR